MTGVVCFDFNGTLSLDEDLMFSLLDAVLTRHGRPLPRERYFDDYIGLADDEIARRWLGVDDRAAAAIAHERSLAYVALSPSLSIAETAAAAVRAAAARAPVAIVTSSLRMEVEPVLTRAGLDAFVSALVAGEDVAWPKPDPAPYRLALERLDATTGIAFEDTPAGVASAKAAGLRCCGIVGTVTAGRLAGADAVADALTPELVASFF